MTGNLTLLDVAKRTGSDATVGLVEEILTVAPEMRTLPVVPKSGTSYKVARRIGRPRGAFRSANEGVDPGKSQYEQIDVPMYFFDGQMVVDEAIVKADDGSLGDILAAEGAASCRTLMSCSATRFTAAAPLGAKGFLGLKEQVDATLVVDATGAQTSATTAWAVYENPRDGLHLPIGNQGALSLGQWVKQQVGDTASKKYMAWATT